MAGSLLLGLSATHAAAAQAPVSPPAAPAPPASPFAGLTLTAAQRTQSQALTADTQRRQQAILSRQKAGTPPSLADRQELERLALAHNAAMRAVLGAGQRARFDENARAFQDARRAARAQQKADTVGGH